MGLLEDLIDEMREQGREDEAGELEKLKGSNLRKKAGDTDRLAKENESLKAENEALKRGPKVRSAFEKAGVDFGSLSKLERKALEAYDGETDEDAIADFLEENEIDLGKGDDSDEDGGEPDEKDEEPKAAKVARAARSAGAGKNPSSKITADTVSQWSMEQKLQFADDNPDAWEALKRGETVTGVKAPASSAT